MMSARTSCLGPCNLEPVVQIWPEGTVYGGDDETAMKAIDDEHVLGGRTAEAYADPADGRKQRLCSVERCRADG